MFFFVNLLGLVVFLGIGVLASRNRKEIQWRSVASLLTLNLMLAWFLTSFEIGREMITAAAAGFTELINISYVGIAFVFPDWVHVPQMNFFAAALLPILFVVPLFDILTYFGILPFVIRWIGKLLTFLTRAPKFESFFAIEMMFLGNTEALAVSKLQLMKMSKERVLTIGLMSMSCVTAALIAVYVKMMPEAFQIAQYMGTKFITNEFVVMLQIQDIVRTWPAHMQAVMTVFITSFANLGTIGIILGCFKGLVDGERNTIVARNVSYMILSGLLVSLLSAAICGLFVW